MGVPFGTGGRSLGYSAERAQNNVRSGFCSTETGAKGGGVDKSPPWPLLVLAGIAAGIMTVGAMLALAVAGLVSALFGRTQWLTRLFDDRPEPYRPIDVGKD
jgi:hypothetical protein